MAKSANRRGAPGSVPGRLAKGALPSIRRDELDFRPPDWICEITSPPKAGLDKVKKMGVYAQYGVPYACGLSIP
jgi:Uma2 family endonuclease